MYQGLGVDQKSAMRQAFKEAQLELMGTTKPVNMRMKRQGVSGYSNDLVDAFAHWSNESASLRARLDFAPQINAAKQQLDDMTKPMTGDPKTSNVRRALSNEMLKRLNDLESGKNSLYGTTLGALTHRALIASTLDRLDTPRFIIQNLTQTQTHTLPWMVAEYRDKLGTIGAAKMLHGALNDIAPLKILKQAFSDTAQAAKGRDFTSGIFEDMLGRVKDEGERALLERLAGLGRIGREQAQQVEDLPGRGRAHRDIGEGGNARLNTAVDAAEHMLTRIDKGLSYLSDVSAPINAAAELINRAATGLGVYRAEMKIHGDNVRATQRAVDAVDETQVNYSAVNQPPWMRAAGGLARIPLQFKHFGFQQMALIGQNAHRLLSSDPKERQRGVYMLGGLMATTALFAGASGLPTEQFVSPLLTGLKAAGLTDLDWKHFETAVRATTAKALGQAFGTDELGRPGPAAQRITSVLAGGLPRLVGLDMTNNLGLNNIITNGAPDYAKVGSSDYYGKIAQWLASTMGGSVGGIGADAFKTANALFHGDIVDAIQHIPGPKFLSDIAKAGVGMSGSGNNFESERGIKRAPPYGIGEAGARAMGFNLASDAERHAFVFGQMQKRKEEANAKTDAITVYIKNPTADNRRAAVKAGATPAGIERARSDVIRQNAQSVNGLRSTPKTARADRDAAANYLGR
jgi:hypothetical protein